MVDMAHIASLVATGLHPNPVPHSDLVTSTTHKTLRGPRGGLTLCREEYAREVDKSIFPGIQSGTLDTCRRSAAASQRGRVGSRGQHQLQWRCVQWRRVATDEDPFHLHR